MNTTERARLKEVLTGQLKERIYYFAGETLMSIKIGDQEPLALMTQVARRSQWAQILNNMPLDDALVIFEHFNAGDWSTHHCTYCEPIAMRDRVRPRELVPLAAAVWGQAEPVPAAG